ncbi:MAG: Malate/L-lactate dehydrogenase [Chloroflexi bacterium]|nr:Malate/L-lactate dehydrogenase [Chloroflexota bacterium]
MIDLRVEAEDLRAYAAALLRAVGAAEDSARITADVLVASDLRGHESHGVARLEKYYVRPLQAGLINADAKLTVLHETAATIAFDAMNGLGHPSTKYAMDACIAKARTAGLCIASIRHSNHYGIAAYYAMQALEHDMIGFCCTDAGPLAVPTGGLVGLLGSNPIAFAAPAGLEQPFVLDMATSVVPVGKVEVKARRETPLPAGWAVDAYGNPATDAAAVLNGLSLGQGGGLMPLGGAEAGHKGFGLSAMVDILCGVLAGASSNLGRGYNPGEPTDVGHMVAAIDIAAFCPVDEFKANLDSYIDVLHQQPTAPGVDRVRVAGEPEFEAEQKRLRDGIPLHDGVVTSLRALGGELRVASPF